jgi:hypothetical protein
MPHLGTARSDARVGVQLQLEELVGGGGADGMELLLPPVPGRREESASGGLSDGVGAAHSPASDSGVGPPVSTPEWDGPGLPQRSGSCRHRGRVGGWMDSGSRAMPRGRPTGSRRPRFQPRAGCPPGSLRGAETGTFFFAQNRNFLFCVEREDGAGGAAALCLTSGGGTADLNMFFTRVTAFATSKTLG